MPLLEHPVEKPVELGEHFLFDRPSLAVRNFVTGDWSAAGRALYDPASLSPTERENLAKKWGIHNSVMAGLVNISTNPLVLGGIILSLAFPLPMASNLALFKTGVNKIVKRFPGLKFISPVSENYIGTEIPGILQAISMERRNVTDFFTKRLEVIDTKLRQAIGHPLSSKEKLMVGALLDDTANPANQTWVVARKWLRAHGRTDLAEALKNPLPGFKAAEVPAHVRMVVDETRSLFEDAWVKWLKDPEHQERLRQVLGRRQGFQQHLTHAELRQVSRYWPHMRFMTPEERYIAVNEMTKDLYATRAQERVLRGVELRQATPSSADRLGKMLPNPDELEALGAPKKVVEAVRFSFSDKIQRLLEAGKRPEDLATTALDGFGRPIHYSLSYGRGIHSYVDNLARSVAFTLPPRRYLGAQTPSLGERLRTAIDVVAGQGRTGAIAAKTLEDTIIPQVAGGMSVKQSARALSWAAHKETVASWLDKPLVVKAFERTGSSGFRDQIKDWLLYDPSSSWAGLGGSLSGLFYTSTLGLPNPVPAMLNLLQPLSAVAPMGLDNYLVGVKRASEQMFKYAKLRLRGVEPHRAIEEVMPAFARAHLDSGLISTEGVRDLLEESVAQATSAGKFHKLTRTIQSKMMSLFSSTELFNRMSAFEAFMVKGERELPGKVWPSVLHHKDIKLPRARNHPLVRDAAEEFATQMTYATQFGGGPLQRPQGMLNAWAPWSQFSTFPLRTAAMIAGPMVRHPGYGGRAALMAGATYEIARQLTGTDVSRGLLFGGLPEPSGYGPFPVLPVVPPALQLAGASVMSAVTGESEHLKRSLPLLVPGGVGMARGVGYLPGVGQVIAPAIEKPYARWDLRTADGLIPMYTTQGQLRGYYTDTQLLAAGMGIGDVKGERERALTKFLLSQRDEVRETKRQAMEAAAQNDPQHVLKLMEQYEKRHPGQGGLPIRPSDMRALHMRENVTRIERVMETMPPELRDEFHAVIASVMGANYEQFFGLSAPLDIAPTINLREPYRRRPLESMREQMSQGLHGVKIRDRLARQGIDVSNAGGQQNLWYSSTGRWYQR